MFSLQSVPESLHKDFQRFEKQWQAIENDAAKACLQSIAASPAAAEQFVRTIISSEFFAQQIVSKPDALNSVLESTTLPLAKAATEDDIQKDLAAQLREAHASANIDVFDKAIRVARRNFMLRTVWRDVNRLNDMQQTTAELSWFAAACIEHGLRFHYQLMIEQFGVPVDTQGVAQPMLVLGMGKLGALELNLSSDIDLIFVYPDSGETLGKGVPASIIGNQEFFVRLGQKLIKTLDAVTADGFVFRVDMRLRPYGQSGALVMNFQSIENYYQTQGREWERYAMIKARVVATTQQLASAETYQTIPVEKHVRELTDLLHPFTFRKYLDYSAIDAMRAMKELIAREVARKGLHANVKLGAGGIREVEFIVQVFQLIRGGRDTPLQNRSLLTVLPLLVEYGCLPDGVDKQLAEAYVFLRNTEHGIQAFQDRQTQQLPVDADNKLRLAWVMGYPSWDEFQHVLQQHRDIVSAQFNNVIAEPKNNNANAPVAHPEWLLIWQGALEGDAATNFLIQQGMKETTQVVAGLQELRESRPVGTMQATARDHLDELMPVLLEDLCQVENPDESLQRLCQVIEAVARRSVYIVLLLENPSARQQLTKLCSASPWIAKQLTEHPVLLDELLDARQLYSPPDLDTLQDELRREVLRLSWDDLESHMETLRYFRLSHSLRVAACEVTGVLPLMKVSDYLTFIAEVILRHVLDLAWKQMTAVNGRPRKADGAVCDPDFVIVAYGKLGGIELGHGSDLDLVFIHGADPLLSTEGPKEIDNAVFFARLGQKIIHILNTQTISGQLYEVDMRLRPSGNSGLLVSSLTAFEKYQRADAWVWEHQALVRARVVAGSPEVAVAFNELRANILRLPREQMALKGEVVSMRDKMRKQLGSQSAELESGKVFHIKQDAGGIVDIEFMVQYAVLAWANQFPTLYQYTDNIRILESLAAAELLSAEQVAQLIEAYKIYRSCVHRLALQGLSNKIEGDQFVAERAAVSAIWQSLLGDAPAHVEK